MVETFDPDDPYRPLFRDLCVQLGFCLHDKGEKRVEAARSLGVEAMVKAVFQAEGMDFDACRTDLKKAVRDCVSEHLAALPPR